MRLTPHFLLLPMVVASVQVVCAQDTAYQALRTLGSSKDQELLSRVVEVKGRNGAPQPETWLIVIDDPRARGGVREVEISGGKITSERTPVQAYSGTAGPVMDMSRLNLDSQGAFTVAEDEARAAGIAFDSVDYLLRPDEERGAPEWVLQLLDRDQRGVGTLRIAANDGAVVSREFQPSRSYVDRQEDAPPPPRRSVRESRPPAYVPEERAEDYRDDRGYASERTYEPREERRAAPPRSASSSRRNAPYTTGNAPRSATGGNNRAPGRTTTRAYTNPSYESDEPGRRSVEEVGRDVGYRVNRRVHRIGGALQKFFTGKRTVDEKFREPYDNE